jgi:hypothetical protein
MRQSPALVSAKAPTRAESSKKVMDEITLVAIFYTVIPLEEPVSPTNQPVTPPPPNKTPSPTQPVPKPGPQPVP